MALPSSFLYCRVSAHTHTHTHQLGLHPLSPSFCRRPPSLFPGKQEGERPPAMQLLYISPVPPQCLPRLRWASLLGPKCGSRPNLKNLRFRPHARNLPRTSITRQFLEWKIFFKIGAAARTLAPVATCGLVRPRVATCGLHRCEPAGFARGR